MHAERRVPVARLHRPASAEATVPILTAISSQLMKVRSLARKIFGSTRVTLPKLARQAYPEEGECALCSSSRGGAARQAGRAAREREPQQPQTEPQIRRAAATHFAVGSLYGLKGTQHAPHDAIAPLPLFQEVFLAGSRALDPRPIPKTVYDSLILYQ